MTTTASDAGAKYVSKFVSATAWTVGSEVNAGQVSWHGHFSSARVPSSVTEHAWKSSPIKKLSFGVKKKRVSLS